MTEGERRLLADAEEEVANAAERFSGQETSGIRPPPTVEVNETNLETEHPFASEFGGSDAQTEPGNDCPDCPDCPPGTGCDMSVQVTIAGCVSGVAATLVVCTDGGGWT